MVVSCSIRSASFSFFTIHASDSQTDGRTDRQTCRMATAILCVALHGKTFLSIGNSSQLIQSIGADFHKTIVTISPGEKLLIGHRPVRNWTQLQLNSFPRKFNKNCSHQSCSVRLQIVCRPDLRPRTHCAPQTL